MYLTEGEGKTLFKEAGIPVPDFFFHEKGATLPSHVAYPAMLKAQTLSGSRGKAGLIKEAADAHEAEAILTKMWKQQSPRRYFESILIEPRLQAKREFYLSVTYDTLLRKPMLMLSKFGGMDIELVAKRQPDAVVQMELSLLHPISQQELEQTFVKAEVRPELFPSLSEIVHHLYRLFLQYDCELAEINPLIETENGFMAVDAKIILDDTALYRHELPFPRRMGGRPLTTMEEQARAIDGRSHRGVVGRTFIELDGNIAVLSSGGGASVTCLDALIHYGGRPANFAEYSGNPEREDVRDLTKLLLSKEGLAGLWVVGPTANFTDVHETIGGIIDALKEVKPSFPVVIRRAGPNDEKARELVEHVKKETGLDITFYGEEIPMTETAKILLEKCDPNRSASGAEAEHLS